MKRWIFLLSLVCTSAIAANFLNGKGTFIAIDGDSYDFIKKQLIHEGTKSIVSGKLDELGLNKDVFWQKYENKLNEKFVQIEDSLRSSYAEGELDNPKKYNRFKERLRRKKLKAQLSFIKMNDMLTKFSIKKISRSQRNANYRYIKLEGDVDTKLVTKIYYNLVRGKKSSDYGSLFINVNYQLNGISYSELGIENENDFEGEVTKSWIEWFSKNKPINIANVLRLEGDKKEMLASYLKRPSELMLSNIPEVFVNSLLLEIEVKVIKKKFDKTINLYSFEYEGNAYLKDLQTNLVMGTYKFSRTQKSYRLATNSGLANLVANHVYQLAIGDFPTIQKNIKEITPITSIEKISVTEFKNLQQVNSFINLIEDKGVKYSLKVEFESIGRQRADLILYFDGNVTEVKEFISTMQSAKKGLSYQVIDVDTKFGIKFNKEVETL
ncbi:MAG: hypothetical protein HON90_17205 [Halobacteriovoraceae bacterium]|jgi:hypothetical protein|nr:hypothetical protein [Halobacteriovoraceae bacterium]